MKNLFKVFVRPIRNFGLNSMAASFFYVGCFFVLRGMIGFVDPATYSESIRYERAKERYDKVDPTYDNDSTIMNAWEQLEKSKESPVQKYFIYIVLGSIPLVISYLVLNKIGKLVSDQESVYKNSSANNGYANIENSNVSDELAKLNELRKNGVLTEEEFSQQKKKLLNS